MDQPPVVHERQHLSLCAKHSINNLLQLGGPDAVTKAELDAVAVELFGLEQSVSSSAPWFNPNRSKLGLGDYSVGVLEKALETRDCVTRRLIAGEDATGKIRAEMRLDAVRGFIVNERVRLLGIPVGRHWRAIGRRDGCWYRPDDALTVPT